MNRLKLLKGNPWASSNQMRDVLEEALPWLPPVPAGKSLLRRAREAILAYDGVKLAVVRSHEN